MRILPESPPTSLGCVCPEPCVFMHLDEGLQHCRWCPLPNSAAVAAELSFWQMPIMMHGSVMPRVDVVIAQGALSPALSVSSLA